MGPKGRKAEMGHDTELRAGRPCVFSSPPSHALVWCAFSSCCVPGPVVGAALEFPSSLNLHTSVSPIDDVIYFLILSHGALF